jgi:excisionase family DNA binding protein
MSITQTFHQQQGHHAELFQHKLQYSRDEAATLIGVSLRTLDRLIADNQIEVRHIGRRVLVHRDVLQNFTKRDHQTAVIQ